MATNTITCLDLLGFDRIDHGRSVELDDETLAELSVLCGFDDDLTGQITATSNRIRGPLTQIHPPLERALGPHLDHPAAADLLTRCPTPQALKTAGRGHVKARLKKRAQGR